MKIKSIILAYCLLFCTCVTFRLENQLKKLNPVIAKWYEVHEVLMETKIPTWIDERSKREKIHFLRLPQKLQLAYISMFWKIRTEELREEYYIRIATANKFFYGEGELGWQTHRGRVLLLCGLPYFKRYITVHDLILQNQGNPNWQQPQYSNEGYVYEMWEYYQRGYLVRYIFKYYSPNTWRRDYVSTHGMGEQASFEKRCREQFAPTEEGWDLWGNVLLQWIKATEKNNE